MAADNSFHLTLLSNAETPAGFNENKTSSFIVDLPKEVKLEGDWKVAVSEIQYQNTINNVTKRNNRVSFESSFSNVYIIQDDGISFYPAEKPIEHESEFRTIDETVFQNELRRLRQRTFKHTVFFDVPEGSYHTVAQVLKAINDIVYKKYEIESFLIIDVITHKVIVNPHANVVEELTKKFRYQEFNDYVGYTSSKPEVYPLSFKLQGQLATMLGFEPDVCCLTNEATSTPRLSLGVPAQMMVYCSVIEPQIVGDVYAKIIRVLPTVKGDAEYGDMIAHRFTNRNYVKVLSKNFKRIGIELRSTTGEMIRFKFGTLYIQLSFVKE